MLSQSVSVLLAAMLRLCYGLRCHSIASRLVALLFRCISAYRSALPFLGPSMPYLAEAALLNATPRPFISTHGRPLSQLFRAIPFQFVSTLSNSSLCHIGSVHCHSVASLFCATPFRVDASLCHVSPCSSIAHLYHAILRLAIAEKGGEATQRPPLPIPNITLLHVCARPHTFSRSLSFSQDASR